MILTESQPGSLRINYVGMRQSIGSMRLGIAANGHVENRASRGVNGIGVGWTNRGYIEGVFFVLLYPALARRMQLSLVPLVVPLKGTI